MKDSNQVLITYKPDSCKAAEEEIHASAPDAKHLKVLEPGLVLLELPLGFNHFAAKLAANPPIFLQHMFPVNFQIPLKGDPADPGILGEFAAKLEKLLTPKKSFSVQTRVMIPEPAPYQPFNINQSVSTPIMEAGFELDVRNPKQVISLLATPESCYIGVSYPEDNLSDWAGGRHRLAREGGQISRAEFKLLEAIKIFRLQFPPEGVAVDLGAAPGGWSRILMKQHLNVWAVDPAELHPSVARNPLLTHYRETVQMFLHRVFSQKFDVVVNDLKMDALDSAGVTNQFYNRLNPGGLAVMTLKLPESDQLKKVRAAKALLAQKYRVLGLKQLFHNRLEATIALEKTE